ncbi:hypothetical protein Riv7116_2353 [Rivularia sp. PCC 7116]|nr:hypothetical protein Riv7116_2353 [Rivularia sp. PCC 7116]
MGRKLIFLTPYLLVSFDSQFVLPITYYQAPQRRYYWLSSFFWGNFGNSTDARDFRPLGGRLG